MKEENINTKNITFDKDYVKHIVYSDSEGTRFPERCAYFMKLQMDDREKVIKSVGLCTKCAAHKHKGQCWRVWDNRNARHIQCDRDKNNKDKFRCTRAWYICKEHQDDNKEKAQRYLSRWGRNLPTNVVHETL